QLSTESSDKIGDRRSVVDGQQRLTTITLFFKALATAQGAESLFQQTFYNLANELCLQHNHNDTEVFEAIVSDQLTPKLRATYEGNNVLQAYDYFQANSNALATLKMPELFSRLYFVGIDLTADEDEQQIFDTINSLGVSLTTAEL